MSEPKTQQIGDAGRQLCSSAGLAARPSLEELEATWLELWKHLGEPDYSPSAIDLAKHCFMVGVEWGIKRAANDKVSYHADNAGGAHGKDTNDK